MSSSTLRSLALAATPDWFFGPQSKYILTNDEAHVRFIAAASPAVVLALLDALDQMRGYAMHHPLCSYEPSPAYPPDPECACDCGFDAALARYEEVSRDPS